MKLLLALLSLMTLLVLPARAATLHYVPYELSQLAAASDLVVTGTIHNLRLGEHCDAWPSSRPGTFRLQAEKVIAGKLPEGDVQVSCFEDWTCGSRWTPYAEGQRVLLFLAAPKRGLDSYRILSGGGEGEMPLIGDAAFARTGGVEGYEPVYLTFGESEVIGTLLPLAELSEAVRGFRETYAWRKGPYYMSLPRTIRPRVSLEHAEEFANTSKTAKHLHQEVTTSRGWKP